MSDSALSTKQQITSLWKLGGLGVREVGRRVWAEIAHDDVVNRSYELAYNFLLALFPMLLFLVTVFGFFASYGSKLRSDLFFYFQQALPPSAYDLITKTLDEITEKAGPGKLSFGLLLALWAGSGGTTQLISTLNSAYEVRESRSWIKVHLISVALTAGISACVLAGLFLIIVGGHLAEFAGNKIGLSSTFVVTWKVIEYTLAVGFILLAFALIYYYGPDVKERHWYWITPGSLVGVVLWIATSVGFRVYLHFFNTYSKTYGSLGAVIILLLWFYVTGFAFLVGGEVNAVIEHAAAEQGHPEAKAPGQKAA
jgi:membrane protein